MLRWLTSGESHGPALVGILEGLPAGVAVTTADLQAALARRRLGYGRGARMKFEQDEVRLLGGVRHGLTQGGPVAIEIGNTEWPKWVEVMSRTRSTTSAEPRTQRAPDAAPARPRRPGRHAQVRVRRRPPGARARLARGRPRPASPSARSRRAFLEQAAGIRLVSHVVGIGPVAVPEGADLPTPDDVAALDADPVRCFDPATSAAMVAEIDECHKDGDTLGGVVEVLVYGVPSGLGSYVHADRRLDARLAGTSWASRRSRASRSATVSGPRRRRVAGARRDEPDAVGRDRAGRPTARAASRAA